MSSLDWGGGNGVNAGARYYTANVPTLSGNFSVWAWFRNDYVSGPAGSGRSLVSWGSARSSGANSFDMRVGQSPVQFVCTSFDSSATTIENSSLTHEGLDDQDGQTFLGVVVRRGSDVVKYCVQRGGDASMVGNRHTSTGRSTGNINSGTAYIGQYASGGSNVSWTNLLGEVGILNGTALTEAQITEMAAGANCPVTPTILWRFNTGENATETNQGSGGSTYDAARTGTGFTTGTDFFANLPTNEPLIRSVAASTAGAAYANITTNKPWGTAQNDSLVWSIATDVSTGNISFPAGWTALTPQQVSTAANQTHSVAWMVAGANEPTSYTANLPANADRVTSVIVCVTNVGTTQPDASNGSANSSAMSSPYATTNISVSTSAANAMLLHFAGFDLTSAGAVDWTVPSGFDFVGSERDPNGWTMSLVSKKKQDASGSSGNVSATATGTMTAGSTAWLIALNAATGSSPQVLLADADTSCGSWQASAGATLFGVLNEGVRDDSDYAYLLGNASTFRISLTNANDPVSNVNHNLSYVIMASGGNMTVRWGQGSNTTIAEWSHAPAPASFTRYDQTLNASQADAISNYADMWVEFIAS